MIAPDGTLLGTKNRSQVPPRPGAYAFLPASARVLPAFLIAVALIQAVSTDWRRSPAELRRHSANAFHTSPNCWTKPRIYADPGHEGERLAISRQGALPSDAPSPVMSPNGAYAFYRVENRAGGPTVVVYSERPYLLLIGADGTEALELSWVNEKLILVRVWWGRVAGTDYLVDVEREAIVYSEGFRYGSIAYQQYRQCAEETWRGSSSCRCYPSQPDE